MFSVILLELLFCDNYGIFDIICPLYCRLAMYMQLKDIELNRKFNLHRLCEYNFKFFLNETATFHGCQCVNVQWNVLISRERTWKHFLNWKMLTYLHFCLWVTVEVRVNVYCSGLLVIKRCQRNWRMEWQTYNKAKRGVAFIKSMDISSWQRSFVNRRSARYATTSYGM